MSDPTSIFGSTDQPASPAPNPNPGTSNPPSVTTPDPIANLLSSIKNERGEQKYKTLEEAFNAFKHAQEYIPSLKSELTAKEIEAQKLREQASKVEELERTLQSLISQKEQAPLTPPPALDESKIAELVDRTLTKKQKADQANANIQSVVNTLQQAYGAEAEKKFYDKAKEYGMTVQEINALAAQSPKAVLTMLGISGQPAFKQTTAASTTNTVNTSAFQPQPETFVGRNAKPALIGATSQELLEETHNAKKMVEELHAQGKSVHDLTDPKVYFSKFK